MQKTYQLTVREAPKSVNAGGGGSRSNPYAAAKEKKRWEAVFAVELLAARVDKGMSHCAVSVNVNWKRRNHRDLENWRHPVVKPLADTLVRFGYLPDDTEEFFVVKAFAFSYPEAWPYRHPGITAAMDISLEATYDD